jgi:hypothetical protein
MSRRVANKRSNQFRGRTARQTVRYGWRKQRRMAIAFAMEAQRRLGLVTEEIT